MLIKSKAKRELNRKTEVKQYKEIKTIDRDELEFKLANITNSRDRAICSFLYYTGLRVSELVNINYGDVFEDIKWKAVKPGVVIRGKGNRERLIPICAKAVQCILAIDRYNRQTLHLKRINRTMPLFVSRQANRLCRRQIYDITKKYLNCSPHVLRHTCFTVMRRAGVPGEVIQKQAGHSSYNTTLKYYMAIALEEMRAAVSCFDNEDDKTQFHVIENETINERLVNE